MLLTNVDSSHYIVLHRRQMLGEGGGIEPTETPSLVWRVGGGEGVNHVGEWCQCLPCVWEREKGGAVSGWLRKLQVTFSEWRPVTVAMALMDVDLLLEDEMSHGAARLPVSEVWQRQRGIGVDSGGGCLCVCVVSMCVCVWWCVCDCRQWVILTAVRIHTILLLPLGR